MIARLLAMHPPHVIPASTSRSGFWDDLHKSLLFEGHSDREQTGLGRLCSFRFGFVRSRASLPSCVWTQSHRPLAIAPEHAEPCGTRANSSSCDCLPASRRHQVHAFEVLMLLSTSSCSMKPLLCTVGRQMCCNGNS